MVATATHAIGGRFLRMRITPHAANSVAAHGSHNRPAAAFGSPKARTSRALLVVHATAAAMPPANASIVNAARLNGMRESRAAGFAPRRWITRRIGQPIPTASVPTSAAPSTKTATDGWPRSWRRSGSPGNSATSVTKGIGGGVSRQDAPRSAAAGF